MLKSAFGRLSTGVCRQPQWAYVGVFMYSLPGCSGLCSGVCRQPQWVYVGVFMYSLAGCSFVLPADYAPVGADSRSGFMSGCLCIHWPGGALSLQRFMLRRVQTAAVGLCRGVYVFIGRVERIMLRHMQTAAVGLCRGVYAFIGRVAPVLRSEICHIIHAEMLSRLFMGFSAGCFSPSRPLCSVNLSWTNFARSESPV